MNVLISTGEASGDAYGACLIGHLRTLVPGGVKVWATGGARIKAVADTLLADSSQWGAISIAESLKVLPRVVRGVLKSRHMLLTQTPGLFVPIDFGFVNVRLARFARQRGWKVLYFVPPGSWRRDRQGQEVARLSDAISTPFPWSAEILTAMGAKDVHWFGHPIKEVLKAALGPVVGAAELPPRREQLAVLPGSRTHEIENNIPLIAQSIPAGYPVEFALAPGANRAWIEQLWRTHAPKSDATVTVGRAAEVLLRSKAAIVCSGTATLEAALCGCPTAVVYQVSRAMVIESKLIGFKKPEFVALPNILLQRMALPEFIGFEALAELVRPAVESLLSGGPEVNAQLAAFEELDQLLGPDDAVLRTAELAVAMMAKA